MIHRPQRARASLSWALLVLVGTAACASSGESMAFEEGVVVLLHRADGESGSAAVVDDLTTAAADFVILAAGRDSAWFADVAARAGLSMSGPSIEQGLGFAFLAGREALGDTTIAIPVEPGGAVVLHDALYELADGVFLDLIAFRADSAHDTRALVHSVLEYIATDVMTNAPLVMGIHAPDRTIADSIEVLLRPSFRPVSWCEGGAEEVGGESADVRLFMGTPAQIRCDRAGHAAAGEQAVLARLLLRR